jgi:hypothetical protein
MTVQTLTFILQTMLAVMRMLTPGRQNKFIDCQKAKVRIAVLPILDVKTHWKLSLELLECTYLLHEFTREWLKNPNRAITGHSSQHRMSGLLPSITWTFYRHSSTGLRGCRNGIPLLCIKSSLSTTTCLITWMAWWELAPRSRHNARKTYSLLWSLHSRICPNIILKWL